MSPYQMPAPPAFERLLAADTPGGLVIRPRSNAASWLVEAVVWVLGAAVAAAMLVLGTKGTWVPVAGAVLLVPIGLRALVRTIRVLVTGALREVRITVRAPRPCIVGRFATAPLDQVARFGFERAAGDLYFCAYDHAGRTTHLVTLEPDERRDYAALAAWLGRPAPTPS